MSNNEGLARDAMVRYGTLRYGTLRYAYDDRKSNRVHFNIFTLSTVTNDLPSHWSHRGWLCDYGH